MNSSVKVFVYGTLMSDQGNHHVIKDSVIHVEPGSIRGRLYSVSGYYPAAVLEGDSIIVGEWLTILSDSLKYTDRLEGYRGPGMANHYDRVQVQDISGNQEGWVYVYPSSKFSREIPYPLIKSGSWKSYSVI